MYWCGVLVHIWRKDGLSVDGQWLGLTASEANTAVSMFNSMAIILKPEGVTNEITSDRGSEANHDQATSGSSGCTGSEASGNQSADGNAGEGDHSEVPQAMAKGVLTQRKLFLF